MPFIKKFRKQKALWWEMSGMNDVGELTFEDPVEVDVRWDDKVEHFVAADGKERISKSIIICDREMKPGDMLWRGTEAAFNTEHGAGTDPRSVVEAGEIYRFDSTPDVKAKEFLWQAYL